MTVIARVGFCEQCFINQHPRTGIFFVVAGKKGWHIYKAQAMGKIGYVPTNYRLIKSIGENIVYEKICGIHGCGVNVYFDNSQQMYRFDFLNWQRGIMDNKSWNALVTYKRDEDYLI